MFEAPQPVGCHRKVEAEQNGARRLVVKMPDGV